MSNKRERKVIKADSSRSSLQLGKRPLPQSIQLHLMNFSDPSDLTALLKTSRTQNQTVRLFLRQAHSVELPSDLDEVAQFMRAAAQEAKSLRSITLHGGSVDRTTWLPHLVSRCSATFEQMNGSPMASTALVAALAQCRNLRRVSLYNATDEFEDGFDAIVAGEQTAAHAWAANCRKLESLRLGGYSSLVSGERPPLDCPHWLRTILAAGECVFNSESRRLCRSCTQRTGAVSRKPRLACGASQRVPAEHRAVETGHVRRGKCTDIQSRAVPHAVSSSRRRTRPNDEAD